MTTPMIADQLEMLRVKIESALPTPLLLVVSSARDDDGKGRVASELARNMEAAGYSTVLIRTDEPERDAGASRSAEVRSLLSLAELVEAGIAAAVRPDSVTDPNTIFLPAGEAQRAVSLESVRTFAAECRTAYAVTIVDAAVMLSNSFSMLAAGAADAVLLCARQGRRVCAADRDFAKLLAVEQLPFLGVVSVADSFIAAKPVRTGASSVNAKLATAPVILREVPST